MYGLLMSPPFTPCIPAAFVLNAGYDSPGSDVIHHRITTSSWARPYFSLFWMVRKQDLATEVSRPLRATRSSLGRLSSRWCLEISLSLRRNWERGENTLYGINWLVCVSILTRLPLKCSPPCLQNETLKVKTSPKQSLNTTYSPLT